MDDEISKFFEKAQELFEYNKNLYLVPLISKNSQLKFIDARLLTNYSIQVDIRYRLTQVAEEGIQLADEEDYTYILNIELCQVFALIPGYTKAYLYKLATLWQKRIMSIVNEKLPVGNKPNTIMNVDADEVLVNKYANREDWEKAFVQLTSLIGDYKWLKGKKEFLQRQPELKLIEQDKAFKHEQDAVNYEYQCLDLYDLNQTDHIIEGEVDGEGQAFLKTLAEENKHGDDFVIYKHQLAIQEQVEVLSNQATCKDLAGCVPSPSLPQLPKPLQIDITKYMLQYSIEKLGKIQRIDQNFERPVIQRKQKYKYFLQPGQLQFEKAFPTIDFDRFYFAHNFAFFTKDQLLKYALPVERKIQQQENLQSDLDEEKEEEHEGKIKKTKGYKGKALTNAEIADKFNLTLDVAPQNLSIQQKFKTYYTVKDVITGWGIMQNNLCDNTVYIDKLLTLQIMALMSETDPQALNIDLKTNHIDLTKFYTFDNSYKFYSFQELYRIKLDDELEPQYFGKIPKKANPQNVVHILSYIKLLLKTKTCSGPFVIQLDRKDGKKCSSQYVVVKKVEKGQSIEGCFEASNKNRIVKIQLETKVLTFSEIDNLSDSEPINEIFAYLHKHQVEEKIDYLKQKFFSKGKHRYTLVRLFNLQPVPEEQLKHPKFYCIEQIVYKFGLYEKVNENLTVCLLNTFKYGRYVFKTERKLVDYAVLGHQEIENSKCTLEELVRRYMLVKMDMLSNEQGIDMRNVGLLGLCRLRTMVQWKKKSTQLLLEKLNQQSKGSDDSEMQQQFQQISKDLDENVDTKLVPSDRKKEIKDFKKQFRDWTSFNIILQGIINYAYDNKLSVQQFTSNVEDCYAILKSIEYKRRFQILNYVRRMDEAIKKLENDNEPQALEDFLNVVQRDCQGVYDIRNKIMQYQICIKFKESPSKTSQFTFFLAELCVKRNLHDLIDAGSKRLLKASSKILIKSSKQNQEYIDSLNSKEKGDESGQEEKAEQHIMYQSNGSVDTSLKKKLMTPSQVALAWTSNKEMWLPVAITFIKETNEYREYTQEDLGKFFAGFQVDEEAYTWEGSDNEDDVNYDIEDLKERAISIEKYLHSKIDRLPIQRSQSNSAQKNDLFSQSVGSPQQLTTSNINRQVPSKRKYSSSEDSFSSNEQALKRFCR